MCIALHTYHWIRCPLTVHLELMQGVWEMHGLSNYFQDFHLMSARRWSIGSCCQGDWSKKQDCYCLIICMLSIMNSSHHPVPFLSCPLLTLTSEHRGPALPHTTSVSGLAEGAEYRRTRLLGHTWGAKGLGKRSEELGRHSQVYIWCRIGISCK